MRLFNRLQQASFLKNVATLASGAAFAQLIAVAMSPLLTRIFSPEVLGVHAVFVAWMSNLAVVASARYEMALVLPKKSQRAQSLLVLALGINTLFLCILLPLSVISGAKIAQLLGVNALAPYMVYLPIAIWLVAASSIYTQWNNRQQRYRANAQSRMMQSVGVSFLQLSLGVFGFGLSALIFAQIIGQILALWVQVKGLLIPSLKPKRWLETKALALHYKNFPLVNTPHAFVVALQESVLLAMIANAGGAASVGAYALVLRVMKLPAAFIGAAVSQIVYRDLAHAYAHQLALTPILNKALLLLTLLSVIPFSILAFFAPELFAWVFGVQWRMAGEMAQYLIPSFVASFIVGPVFTVPMILNQQRRSLQWVLCGIVTNLAIFAMSFYLLQDLLFALACMSIGLCIYFILYTTWIYVLLSKIKTVGVR